MEEKLKDKLIKITEKVEERKSQSHIESIEFRKKNMNPNATYYFAQYKHEFKLLSELKAYDGNRTLVLTAMTENYAEVHALEIIYTWLVEEDFTCKYELKNIDYGTRDKPYLSSEYHLTVSW